MAELSGVVGGITLGLLERSILLAFGGLAVHGRWLMKCEVSATCSGYRHSVYDSERRKEVGRGDT